MTKKTPVLALLTVLSSFSAFGSVTAYFNHHSSTSYTEPYRTMTRSGDNLEQVIIDQIQKAKKSVFVAVQELRLPKVAEALIAKKNAGVDVRVILEHDYNFSVMEQQDSDGEDEYEASKLTELRAFVDANQDGKITRTELNERDAIHMLRSAGVKIMDDTSDNSSGSGLMHHKFVVVDKRYVLISTANFTMSCIHGDLLAPTSRGNPNSMMVVQSPALAKHFDGEFQQLWGNGKRGNFGHNKTFRGPQTVKVGNTKITVQFSPTSARYTWDETVNGLIAQHLNGAKDTIKAALFVYSDQRLGDEIQAKHDEGVELDFLVETKFAYRNYSELLDMMGLEMLDQKCSYEADNNPWSAKVKNAGIPLLPRGDVLHHKFAVVDNKTVIMGSQNWSEAANYVNDETLIVVENSPVVSSFTEEYDRLKRNSFQGPSQRTLVEIDRLEEACNELTGH